MVAVFTGTGLGLFNTSLTQLGGSSGGSSGLGQLRGGQSVNLATGNLVLQELDENLLVRGLSATLLRTYNSRGTVAGQGQDGWVTGFERRVTLSGALFDAASTVSLTKGDGQTQVFVYKSDNVYVSTDGAGAHDTLLWDGDFWNYVDGEKTRHEIYGDESVNGRLLGFTDFKNFSLASTEFTLLYDSSGRVLEVRAGNGSDSTADAIVFAYNAAGQLSSISTREGGTLKGQVSYGYENANGSGRLVWVQTDLTPEITTDNAWDGTTAANNNGKRFRTSYQNNLIDDRVRAYSNTAEGQVQSRRDGTWKQINNVYQFAEGDADALGSRRLR